MRCAIRRNHPDLSQIIHWEIHPTSPLQKGELVEIFYQRNAPIPPRPPFSKGECRIPSNKLFGFIPNNPLANLTRLPLCKRGIEGDFCIRATSKSPLTPLFQRGNTPPRPNSWLMDNLGL